MRFKNLLFVLMMAFAMNAMGQVPQNWFIDTPSPDDISLNPNTEFYTQGTTSCQMNLHTTNVPYLVSDNYAVNEGASYTFSIDVLDNDTRGRLKIYADFYDAEGNDVYGEAPVYSEDMADWQTISWTATVPDGAVEGYVWIKFYDQDDFVDEAVVYVDNAIFVEDGGENIVVNGGFENWALLGLEYAYCVSNDAVDVRYNADVESVTASDFILNGTAEITFANAEIDAEMRNLVHLSGASAPIEFDLTVDQLEQAGLEGTSSVELYGGIAPIAYTNAANPEGVLANGIQATFRGIISANDAYNNFWVQDGAGAYNGVMGYSFSLIGQIAVGDEVVLTATRDQYYDLNEIVDPVLIQIISSGNEPYAPEVIAGNEIDTTHAANDPMAEKWEGQLVRIENAKVTQYFEDPYFYYCSDDNGETFIKIGDNVDYQLANISMNVGDTYTITGVVDYSYGVYRLNPRNAADIVMTTGISENEMIAMEIYPNPATNVINIARTKKITNVRISNINGAVVIENDGLNNNSAQIDISALNPGVYFVSVFNGSEVETTRLLVK